MLRKIISKPISPFPRSDCEVSSEYYVGDKIARKDDVTKIFSKMTAKRAKALLTSVNPEINFHSREEFAELLAAVCKEYPEIAKKKNTSGKTVRSILICAAQQSHFEWLCNWSRYAQTNQNMAVPIAVGTTGNEAFHNQLRNMMSSVIQIHQTTLRLKLLPQQCRLLSSHHDG